MSLDTDIGYVSFRDSQDPVEKFVNLVECQGFN